MPNNWKTYNFGELVDLKQGLAINKKTKHLLTEDSSELPLFKINNLIKNTVDHYVKKSEVPKQCIVKEDELIYTRTGQVGLIFKGKNGCMHNNCFKIIPNEKLILKDYIYWFLRQPHIVEYANNIASGSVQKDLNHKSFKSIEIGLPKALKEQKAIANILSAIDNKIENNLATNKTIEEMAMALYKHWFVDFGPFQEDEFIESELGKIPKGWEVKRLDDLAHILNSKRVPLSTGQRSIRKGKYPYYGASGVIDNIDDFIFDGEYVIISEDGENLRSRKTPIGFSAVGKFWVNNHAHILEGKKEGINKLIISHIAQMDMNPYLTGAVQPKLNKSNLLSIGISMPKEDSIIDEVLNEFYSISRLIFSNDDEIKSLTKLRDTLLPKLISGEVRLQEFREEVADVIAREV